MASNRRRGVVKQLSNLSIDEVSLVDRGANQHALVSIAKRAPQADDVFEDVEKFMDKHKANLRDSYEKHPLMSGAAGLSTGHGALPTIGVNAANAAGAATGFAGAAGLAVRHAKKVEEGAGEAGRVAGAIIRHPGGAALVGGLAGGAAAGAVVHHHYGDSHFAKNLGDPMDVNALFDVEKKKGSSFGQGGAQEVIDEFTGSDPSGVTDDENGEDGDVGPGGKIGGVEQTKGEDTPPKKKSSKASSKEINPAPLSGLGKSAEFWTSVVSKVLSGESTTEDELDDTIEKHFPGGGAQQPVPGNPQNPMQSPFPGAQGMGQPPTMQTPGVQPMGMGQPTPPPGQATGGMPQQLPPDVIAYIQQLEQALDQATGGQQDGQAGDETGSDSQGSNGSGSNSDDNKKNNPFGKSGDFDMSDDLFLAELAKSLDNEDQREAVGKALEAVSKAEQRAIQAETIAKQERDLRLEKEFISKAAEFNVPVKAEELGPVLKRMAESVTKEDFQVIVKCLNAVSAKDDIFGEVGKRGGGANGSVLDEVNARALALTTGGDVSKALSPEAAVAEVFEMDPRAYDAYLSDHPSRRISR